MRFELRLSRPTDAAILAERAIDPEVRGKPELVEQILAASMQRGPCYTALFAGDIVGAAGVRIPRPGIGTVWAILCESPYRLAPPTAEGMEYIQETLWSIGEAMSILAGDFGLKRVRTYSRKAFPASQKLLEALGFERLKKETENLYFYGKSWPQ